METQLKKETRSHFSRLGLMFFIGTLLIYGVQYGALFIVRAVAPTLLDNVNSAYLVTMIPMYVIAMPVMLYLLYKFVPAKQIEKKEMTVGQWFITFCICYAATYIGNYIGVFLTQIVGAIKGSDVSNVIVDLSTSTSLWFNFFIMVLIAPVFEELIFRKFLIDRTCKYGESVSVLFSGLMFGLFHGNLNQFSYAFLLGAIFGFVYVKTGNIRYTILMHMVINFMGSILGVLILRFIDYNVLQETLANGGNLTDYISTHVPQMIVYMLYAILLFGIVVAGIILFIVKMAKKKIQFAPGEVTIPKGNRFSTTVLNIGMILYFIFWIAMIIQQLLQ